MVVRGSVAPARFAGGLHMSRFRIYRARIVGDINRENPEQVSLWLGED
jgi:hypothetical protein